MHTTEIPENKNNNTFVTGTELIKPNIFLSKKSKDTLTLEKTIRGKLSLREETNFALNSNNSNENTKQRKVKIVFIYNIERSFI
jgi:hypothetical protein